MTGDSAGEIDAILGLMSFPGPAGTMDPEGLLERSPTGTIRLTEKGRADPWKAFSPFKELHTEHVARVKARMKAEYRAGWKYKAFKAVRKGDLGALKELADSAGDRDLHGTHFHGKARQPHTLTILHWAAERLRPEIMEYLLDGKGMDPDAGDGFGETPLFRLARLRNAACERRADRTRKCFDLLRGAGADLDFRIAATPDMTLIEAAVRARNLFMVRALAGAGADPDPAAMIQDGRGEWRRGSLIELAVGTIGTPFPWLEGRVEGGETVESAIIGTLAAAAGRSGRIGGLGAAMDVAVMKRDQLPPPGKWASCDSNRNHIQAIIDLISAAGGVSGHCPERRP